MPWGGGGCGGRWRGATRDPEPIVRADDRLLSGPLANAAQAEAMRRKVQCVRRHSLYVPTVELPSTEATQSALRWKLGPMAATGAQSSIASNPNALRLAKSAEP